MILTHSTDSKLILTSFGSALLIDKEDYKITIQAIDEENPPLTKNDKSFTGEIFLLLGFITVDSNMYVLYVQDIAIVTAHPNYSIFKIMKVGGKAVKDNSHFCPPGKNMSVKVMEKMLNGMNLNSRKNESQNHPRVIEELISLFNNGPSFYYSDRIDLTQTFQHSSLSNAQESRRSFFWNLYLLQPLLNLDNVLSQRWLIPIIQGYVSMERVIIRSLGVIPPPVCELLLVSRRSTRRAGKRYLRRGVDTEGNVANFVETEVMIEWNGHRASFVQVRGSIPLVWSQDAKKYRPEPEISVPMQMSLIPFGLHFDQIMKAYCHNVCILSLISNYGKEQDLLRRYINHFKEIRNSNLNFINYDFSRNSVKKLPNLLHLLAEKLKTISVFWIVRGCIVKNQNGVIRTNCIDCLDRTNVVQSFIAKQVITDILRRLALANPEEDAPIEVVSVLNRMWERNGNALSHQYAGTSALRSHLLKPGESVKMLSYLKDGFNSVSRYYQAQVKHRISQLTIDVLLGIREANEYDTAIMSDQQDFDLALREQKTMAPEFEKNLEGDPISKWLFSVDYDVSVGLFVFPTWIYVVQCSYDSEADYSNNIIIPLSTIKRIKISEEESFSSIAMKSTVSNLLLSTCSTDNVAEANKQYAIDFVDHIVKVMEENKLSVPEIDRVAKSENSIDPDNNEHTIVPMNEPNETLVDVLVLDANTCNPSPTLLATHRIVLL